VVAPRPVVLVHGFLSNYEAWVHYTGPDGFLAGIGVPAFAAGDGQAPGVLNTGEITEPFSRTNTIAQNAAVLQAYITGVKKQTGAEMVDLLGHSMGGMISRYYIDRLMGENNFEASGRDVAQLIMLGHATPWARIASTCRLPWDGICQQALEIRSSYARQILNPQIYRHKGVPFFELAATDPGTGQFAVHRRAERYGRLIGQRLRRAVKLSKIGFLHTELNTSEDAFDEFVKPLLEKRPADFADESDPPAPSPDLGEPLQFSRIYTGKVAAGGSQDLTIHIEEGVSVASFALFDTNGSLDVIVIGQAARRSRWTR